MRGWYIIGYALYGTFNDWIGGLWPALVGPAVSLVLVVIVSKMTTAPPEDVSAIFFSEDQPIIS